MQASFGPFQIDTDPARLDFERVHAWLTTAYWSPGVSRERVEQAARYSADLVGVYMGDRQVAYCRVVSDRTTFAWLCDVFVDADFRGQGIAKAMVQFTLRLPYSAELRRWVLATRDADKLYSQLGFVPLANPDRWMAIQRQVV